MVGIACTACVQSLMLIVALLSPSAPPPVARAAEPAHARGCLTARTSADGPETTGRSEPEPLPAQLQAMSVVGAVKGSEFKFSLYRGIGGGLRAVATDEGLSLTFEGGFGLGGSFSAGTADGLPKPGPAAEGRVSLNARALPVQPPDFGVALGPDGRVQGYTDVKAGKLRTRFFSEPLEPMGDAEGETVADAPVVRRSWSLGSEFKIAAKYTFRSTWSAIADLLGSLAGHLSAARVDQIPPSRPAAPDVVRLILDQNHANRALTGPARAEARRGPVSLLARIRGPLPPRRERRARHARSRRTPSPRAARHRSTAGTA